MGVHKRQPYPERFPSMACLRTSDAAFAMAVDRERERWRNPTDRCLLDAPDSYVHPQLRLGRLGNL